MRKILLTDIGTTEYEFAWELQKSLHERRVQQSIPDTILLTEHHNTYTIGKSGGEDHLLASDDELRLGNITVFKTDRGGDITYHGPGQVVCYPIISLDNYYHDVHRYLRDLEKVVISALRCYGIVAHRDPEYTGVWVGSEKICAIGVKISRWVTMLGFALNVNTDLSYFGRIIPCGIFHKGVTSLSRLLQKPVDIAGTKEIIAEEFAAVFQKQIERVGFNEFLETFAIEPIHINEMEKEHASH